MRHDRERWSSAYGFILAAAGSAIGLGNIWRFPYLAGQGGGAACVVVYLGCVVFVSLPYLLAELALGRHAQRNPVGAMGVVAPGSRWGFVGVFGVLAAFMILSYYSVISGWCLGYVLKVVFAPSVPHDAFVGSFYVGVFFLAIFLLATMMVVLRGVRQGIERAARFLMPLLLALIVLVIIRGITLPGAAAGLEFYLRPDFSEVDSAVILAALGQAFYSLSLGMGVMITYGSYLPKSGNLLSLGFSVALFDAIVALAAGLMIFPALFALGKDPASGPSLVFIVLPSVFAGIPFGSLFACAFFFLLSVAALTSTVSVMEVVVSYLVDEKGWRRTRAVWGVGVMAFLVGVPSALSQGASRALSELKLFGVSTFLYQMDFLWGNVALAVAAAATSLFVGWVWGAEEAARELRKGKFVSGMKLAVRLWGVAVRFSCPAIIMLILLSLFGIIGAES